MTPNIANLTKPEKILLAHAFEVFWEQICKNPGYTKELQAKGVLPAEGTPDQRKYNLEVIMSEIAEKLEICPDCLCKGWNIFTVDGSTLAIQKCDGCEDFDHGFGDDLSAAKASGLKFKDNGHHCIILKKDIPKWALKN